MFASIDFLGDINADDKNEIFIGEHKDLDFNRPDKVYIYNLQKTNSIAKSLSILPNNFTLFQNYPNPFNTNTIISYQLSIKSKVMISIYNILGKNIREILNKTKQPGTHKVLWDGKDQAGVSVPSGIYLCRVKTSIDSDEDQKNIKISLIK